MAPVHVFLDSDLKPCLQKIGFLFMLDGKRENLISGLFTPILVCPYH